MKIEMQNKPVSKLNWIRQSWVSKWCRFYLLCNTFCSKYFLSHFVFNIYSKCNKGAKLVCQPITEQFLSFVTLKLEGWKASKIPIKHIVLNSLLNWAVTMFCLMLLWNHVSFSLLGVFGVGWKFNICKQKTGSWFISIESLHACAE